MTVVHLRKTVEKDGEIVLTDLPVKRGQRVSIIVEAESIEHLGPHGMTAEDLLHSGLVGMWADREGIGDSLEFAHQLREKAQSRSPRT